MNNTTNSSDNFGERVARLETNMAAVLTANVSREAFQNTVLEMLTTLKIRYEDSMNYQKVCDAERDAHEKRIGKSENTLENVVKRVDELVVDAKGLKSDVNDLKNSRKIVIGITSILSGVFAFLATLVANYFHK
jgi:single-stranded DNA-specific DHH superfamily exonuclease